MTDTPTRVILEGVERCAFDKTPPVCFVGSTLVCMHYMGRPVSDAFVMGVSGGAFKMFWVPPWAECNCDLLIVGEEPIRRTFAALGYDYTYLPDRDRLHRRSKAFYHDTITSQLNRGVPLIAIGVVGPPEAGVITGYDEGGDVLYGWSYFQDDPNGYYRSDNWYNNAHGVILIGGQKAVPSKQQVLRDALEWAITLIRQPEMDLEGEPEIGVRRCYSGLAAYDQMLASLTRDEDFPTDNPAALSIRLHALINDGAWQMMEKRRLAAEFLKEMADPTQRSSGELFKAAELYMRLSEVWCEAGMMIPWSSASPDDMLKLTNPQWRAKFSGYVQQARPLDEQAVMHLERALDLLKASSSK
jgi:hypothetical protein